MAASQATARMSAEAASNGLSVGDGPKTHIRVYQACVACRKRKVRCDLGSVDAPHSPPCVRCRRESKECYFSATRRKRKTGDGEVDDDDEIDDEYTRNNGRKRVKAPESDGSPARLTALADVKTAVHANDDFAAPLTPGGGVGNPRPLRRPDSKAGKNDPKENAEQERVSNETAGYLQRGEIFGGHDALNLLATASAGLHPRTTSMSSHRPSLTNVNTPGSFNSLPSPQTNGTLPSMSRKTTQDISSVPVGHPLTYAHVEAPASVDPSSDSGRDIWDDIGSVKKGWFTPEEGIRYVEYFYDHIAPFTPVAPPDFRDVSRHEALFTTEPVLAYTIITVASRFMKLDGPGATSRPYAIHSELWTQLRSLITDIHWGLASFDGVSLPGGNTDPLHRYGLRTLGTVESLLILTEWHPRALHFPTGTYDLLISRKPSRPGLNANGGQPNDTLLEPSGRSDRMCWGLLGNAFHLAVEIGVFDNTNPEVFRAENPGHSAAEVGVYYARKSHLRNLLQVYITQTSGRLELTGMLPESYMADAFIGQLTSHEYQRMKEITATSMDNILQQDSSSHALSANTKPIMLCFWVKLAAIMHLGNQKMFPNRRVTRELITSGEYTTLLKTFEPLLKQWSENFDACHIIPPRMRHILKIEFEYARVYLYSLALQAVVQRCLNVHNTNGSSRSPDKDAGPIPPSVLAKQMMGDRPYIDIVVDACRNVLKVVNEGLSPNGFLKHIPVRTYFRIISVMMILLKTFTVGASEKDSELSLGLFDEAVECLSNSVVDDVHIINSFVERATSLTQQIRSSLVRLPGSSNNRSRGVTPIPPMVPSRTLPPMGPMAPPDKKNKSNASTPSASGYHWNNVLNPGQNGDMYGLFTPNHNNPYALGYTGGRPSNPLHGISTTSYDLNTNNLSIVPPPSFGANGGFDQQLADNGFGYTEFANNENGGETCDWLALPLNTLFTNHSGVDINQTTFGPEVGGLEFLNAILEPSNGTAGFH